MQLVSDLLAQVTLRRQ